VVGFNTFGMYQGRNRQNLRDVSTQFYRDYSLLRMDAIAQNTPMMIEFTPDTTSESIVKYSFYRYDILSNSWDDYKIDSGRGIQVRRCGPFVVPSNTNIRFAFDANGMVVNPDNLDLPQNVQFTLHIERGAYKDEHDVTIYPSGGIHVTKTLDKEL
jgi:hypothetical protein